MSDLGVSNLVIRAFAHVHGHLGWLSALALAHPAVMLRRPRRRVLTVAAIATGLVSAVGALGACLYPDYRQIVKPALLSSAPLAGALFERKEHLGVVAVVLAWAGLALVALAQGRVQDQPEVGRAAFVAYAGAAAAALGSAAAGLVVGVYRSF
ncbi:MAG TPA: hypothetical protein VHH90_04350 [Polyangia bacterium]|nr:hypothetical protein [Polyangia bacterium]